MKNITFSADEQLIESARKIAVNNNTTLNVMFREWISDVSKTKLKDSELQTKLNSLWKETNNFKVGRKLTREEMNER